ncbi:hypothetical protein PAPHI01_0817 [Pancytospora philotis]|nr:hypothetical protein PAPHI01_0817 [Pancytospora philotis]
MKLREAMLVLATYLLKSIAARVFDPGCADCWQEAMEQGAAAMPNPTVKRDVVFATDALKYAPGSILVSAPPSSDSVRGRATGADVSIALEATAAAEASAKMNAAQKEKELLQVERELELKKAEALEHQRAVLERKRRDADLLLAQRPEIVAKKTVPVVVFAPENVPFQHHLKMMLETLQGIRQRQLERIKAAQEITQLDSVTEALATANGPKRSPADYDKLITLAGAGDELYNVPVSPADGNFFIVPHGATGGAQSAGETHEKHHGPLGRLHVNRD